MRSNTGVSIGEAAVASTKDDKLEKVLNHSDHSRMLANGQHWDERNVPEHSCEFVSIRGQFSAAAVETIQV